MKDLAKGVLTSFDSLLNTTMIWINENIQHNTLTVEEYEKLMKMLAKQKRIALKVKKKYFTDSLF
jgi:hypothetical protein